jgi:hypothetical protein
VLASDGELVAGVVGVGALERSWVFTPRVRWTPGVYRLFVLFFRYPKERQKTVIVCLFKKNFKFTA